MKNYWRTGEPMVWATGASLSITLLIALTLVIVVMVNGLGVFWPAALEQAQLNSGKTLLGEVTKREETADGSAFRKQYKIGNRDLYGLDFTWVDEAKIKTTEAPVDAFVLEREEYGNFYGYLTGLNTGELVKDKMADDTEHLLAANARIQELKEGVVDLEDEVSALSYKMEKVRRQLLKAAYNGLGPDKPKVSELERTQVLLQDDFRHLVDRINAETGQLRQYTATFRDAGGREKELALADLIHIYQPNKMSTLQKAGFYLMKLKELFLADPRESNTEGGLFPAIFGTIMLIFIMSLFSFPLGVIAAVYLREYAKEGLLVRLVRIAVNNLAGIPSIVYGIFGLGFFIYGIGGAIDRFFYPEMLPTPTFGTGGILLASLTLALLTVPVVIVSTEEALGAIPREIREGSLALGSTKFQTLMRILLPMASPGIMTGLILAMARAAGEVAPLMITGVVKLAPALPIDASFPFLHLDRKFMHLGFHIFDIGFQSPNIEAAKPMVFVTTLLLVLIVLTMSSIAIRLRNKMKKRYTFGTF